MFSCNAQSGMVKHMRSPVSEAMECEKDLTYLLVTNALHLSDQSSMGVAT